VFWTWLNCVIGQTFHGLQVCNSLTASLVKASLSPVSCDWYTLSPGTATVLYYLSTLAAECWHSNFKVAAGLPPCRGRGPRSANCATTDRRTGGWAVAAFHAIEEYNHTNYESSTFCWPNYLHGTTNLDTSAIVVQGRAITTHGDELISWHCVYSTAYLTVLASQSDSRASKCRRCSFGNMH
jgi:hypothetical protein